MQYIYLIPQKAVSVLKQRARWTKRAECIPHHQALELTAKAVGFDHRHQVAAAAEQCKPIEDAYIRLGAYGRLVGGAWDHHGRDGVDRCVLDSGLRDFGDTRPACRLGQ